jgi:hypothetical protein
MSFKGSKLKYGNRDYIFNMSFYKKKLVEKNNITLSFVECKKIINACNKNIAEFVVEETDGFKLPFGLGYLVVSKYIPVNPAIDWKRTKEFGQRVYHLNLHTLGFAIKINWFRVGRINHNHFNEVYKFSPYKTLSLASSMAFRSGRKLYSEWSAIDFIEKGRVENLMNKKYRKELKT